MTCQTLADCVTAGLDWNPLGGGWKCPACGNNPPTNVETERAVVAAGKGRG